MPKQHSDSYDAVIIGAGIGGLVCGCYLAKAGMKVLIAEQHHKPGGYCTSFKRNSFTFDAAAHAIGGYEHGNTGIILRELGLDRKMKISRADPSDIVVTPDCKLTFWNDLDRTIEDFQKVFPGESKNIRDFFLCLSGSGSNSHMPTRNRTFQDFLDTYFKDEKIKNILSFPLLGSGGLPPSRMSAFIGTKIFREFILDGGYYPENGIQTFSSSLAETFQELGGELRLSSAVKSIPVQDGIATGILLNNDDFIPSRWVVSNCDARQTFLNLLSESSVPQEFKARLETMVPSLSGFILYLASAESISGLPHYGSNLWYLMEDDLDTLYDSITQGAFTAINGFVLHVYPDRRRIFAFMNAPFKNRNFWDDHKSEVTSAFMNTIEETAIPGLSKNLVFCEAATPLTLQRYTGNYNGATFGWAATPSQLADPDLKKPSFLRNLYLAGHWTTHGLGIPGVVYTGHDIAVSILKRNNTRKSMN